VTDGGMTGVAHEVRMILRGESRAHQILRSRVGALVMLTLIVDAIGTTVMWLLERHAHQTSFTTWPGALFWTSAQLTTVSSQQANPVTAAGKAFDILLQLWGITVTVTLAASVVTFFLHRHQEEMKRRQP
jgi:Ion channel